MSPGPKAIPRASTRRWRRRPRILRNAFPLAKSQWALLFGEGRGVPTVVLCLGIGIHAIDVFVIAAVMPSVVADIGGATFYAWPTMLYMVASILGSACSAPVKARLGPRGAYTLAALVFLAGTI